MTPKERGLLKRVADAAIHYIAIVNEPTPGPNPKALDAERNAFDELEDAVKARPQLNKFNAPEDKGAWS
jgi:hypothetical protein